MAVGKFYYAITSQSILVNRCIVNEKNNKVAEKNTATKRKKIMWRWVQKFPHRLWNGTECNRQANNTRKRCEELIKPMIER